LPPRQAEFQKPKPGERPAWVEALEEAFIKLTSTDEGKAIYGDPEKGGTVEQVWRTSGLFTGKLPVCLLSTDQPSVPTEAIDRVIKTSSKELVDTLIKLFPLDNPAAFQILYHDGNLGHSITLLAYDAKADRFTYHDPWPGPSLLTWDFNAAGVDAKSVDGSWSITSAELAKVVFAAFVRRPLWAEYTNETYYLTYDQFVASDFWKFFHVSVVGREGPDADNRTVVALKTGGFQSELRLAVTVTRNNRVARGVLETKRSWMIGPPYGLNPFALDIVRSFVAALIPPPDRDTAAPLVEMLHRIRDSAYAEQMLKEGPEHSVVHRALFTYLGPVPGCEAIFPFSNLSMNNLTRDGTAWLQTTITTDAL